MMLFHISYASKALEAAKTDKKVTNDKPNLGLPPGMKDRAYRTQVPARLLTKSRRKPSCSALLRSANCQSSYY